MREMMRERSAWLPLVMSFLAFSFLLGYVALFGISQEPQADEGTPARIFQLLLAGQAPIVAYFALRWLPRMPRQALKVIALQIVAGLLPFTTVFFLEL